MTSAAEIPGVETQLPLFPLGTVLFPGGLLPLQIFETRYVDMVRRCMRDDSPFGVVLILDGAESRQRSDQAAPSVAAVGTMARIVDFTELPNGLLGITARGEHRIEILDTHEQSDHLLTGRVIELPDPPSIALPGEYDALLDILQQLLAHPVVNRLGVEADFDDAASVAGRLADLLPVAPEFKQQLLELDDPLVCLAEIERLVRAMQEQGGSDG